MRIQPLPTYAGALNPDRAHEIETLSAAPDDAVVDNRQAALFLGLAPETLEVWRSTRRQNIPYIKLGRAVRYLMRDLRQFQDACRVYPLGGVQ